MPVRTSSPSPYSSVLSLLVSAAFCASPILANASAASPAPTKPPKALPPGVELLTAPPLLQERDSSGVNADLHNKPASNTMTKAVQRTGKKTGREIEYDMLISYAEGKIYNPATGLKDTVKLRSYNGKFVAPTVVMKPGQTVRFNLMNRLPVQGADCTPTGPNPNPNTPAPVGCFNVTNLHSHGLWVSPTGNSDNVLLSLDPGVDFEYEYNVPTDHPAGTFWYHPHKHGSTAMQVASGMSGALIVEGNRYPTKDDNGDLDTLLKDFEPKGPNGGSYREVMLLQQIPYACFDGTKNPDGTGKIETDATGRWICKDGQVGVVEDFNQQVGNFTAWDTSGRYTLINGKARPQLQMEAGRVYRWRMIDAGFNETVNLRIRKVVDESKINPRAASNLDRANEVASACIGTDVTQFEVATDGLTHDKTIVKTTNTLQPGYRSDILFVLPEKGKYCVYDDESKAAGSLNAKPENAKVLAIIDATGNAKVADQTGFMTQQLLKAADKQPVAGGVRAQVKADLQANLKLSKFVPHPTITDKEIADSKQPVIPIAFNLNFTAKPTLYLVNGEEYKSDRVDQTLILGKAQAWKLSSVSVSHPFHIHVNPFQIVSITPKAGKTLDPQYDNLVGTWKDTLLVTEDVDIEIRSRYERYIGEFVLHCHILEHEDQGMMQNVQVVLPDGKGGAQKKGHH